MSASCNHDLKVALGISDNLGLELILKVALWVPRKLGDDANGLLEVVNPDVVVEGSAGQHRVGVGQGAVNDADGGAVSLSHKLSVVDCVVAINDGVVGLHLWVDIDLQRIVVNAHHHKVIVARVACVVN